MVAGGVQRWIPVVIISVAALPVGVLATALLKRWRIRRGLAEDLAWRRSWTESVMVGATLPWVWMILTPLQAPRDVRLTPFVDLAELPDAGAAAVFFQVVGNLLVFAAFGFGAAIRWRLPVGVIMAVAAVASVIVEALQYALALGRVSSVDDVILNTAGAGLAAILARRFWAARTPSDPVPASVRSERSEPRNRERKEVPASVRSERSEPRNRERKEVP